jgi:hypothetical protein
MDDEPFAAPKLPVVTGNEAFRPFDCLSVVGANQRLCGKLVARHFGSFATLSRA